MGGECNGTRPVASSRALCAIVASLSFVQAYRTLEEGGLQSKLLVCWLVIVTRIFSLRKFYSCVMPKPRSLLAADVAV